MEDLRKQPSVRIRLCSGLFTTALLVFFWLLAGCSGTGSELMREPGQDEPVPPKWVCTGEAPEITGAVCAVGIAGATYFRSDAVKKAAEEARNELARTVAVRVQTAMLDIQTGGGGRRGSRTIMEVSSFVNEIILEGSRIVEVWHDEYGRGFAGISGYTYALACIDSASLSSALPR